jgi:hypothetical protein
MIRSLSHRSLRTWDVTYEIVTPESAEQGDADERGHIARHVHLRDAIQLVTETRTSNCGGVEAIEANCSDIAQARWITIINGMEFMTGAQESRSIHFPAALTRSSRRRIARLFGIAK